MKWLRERPERAEELDTVDNKGRWKADKAGEEEKEVMGLASQGTGKSGAKGQLFDDEDDEVDDDEEEEEEEDAPEAAPAPAPPVKGQAGRR